VTNYDVIVIGAGVVGCAIARELSGYDLNVALLEARSDVGDATSKANTAILHTGFDAKPGSLEASLVQRGYYLLGEYALVTGIPVERTGAILVAWTDEQLESLPSLRDKAIANGYERCELIDADEVYRREPHLGLGALGGLTVPHEAIICPWTTTLAYATEALSRGVDVRLNTRVTSIAVADDGSTRVFAQGGGDFTTRWVVNAAGLGSDVIDAMFGHDRFTITPRRGELLVYDKAARNLVNTIVLPVPSKVGKGVLISPTIYGNVMLGPTAQDLADRTNTSTSESGFEFLLDKGNALMPELLREEVTAAYAGLRAATEHADYVIDADRDQRYVCVGGIRSTGLTASMAIGEYVAALLRTLGVTLQSRTDLPSPPRMPNIGEAFPRPYQRADLIATDGEYGRIVCFCERVSRGEIRDAFASPIPPSDLDGLRRRTRVLMGRCQGFYCGAEVEALMATAITERGTT
jgi:glycerol-3-phosphate dehydrogenase